MKRFTPDAPQPGAPRPQGPRPVGAKPDGLRSDASRPDAALPDAGQPAAAQPAASRPDARRPTGSASLQAVAKPSGGRAALYATPPPGTRRLRVLLVTPVQMPRWLLRVFELAAHNPWLELVVLPVGGDTASSPGAVPVDLRLLLRYEHRRFAPAAFKAGAVHSYPGVAFEPGLGAYTDVIAVRGHATALQPDLVLLFGEPHWAEALGDRAPWGCWALTPSLTDAGHAARAVLGPVMRGEVATHVELRLAHLDRPPTSLVRSGGSTCRGSLVTQCEQVFGKIPALLMRALRQLASGQVDIPTQRTALLELATGPQPAAIGDGARTLASTLRFRVGHRWATRAQRCDTLWHVLVREATEPLDPASPHLDRPRLLSAPGDEFWADPCLVEHEGRRLLFVEQWSDTDSKGVIACVELLAGGAVRRLGTVLQTGSHLSYPQPFAWQGAWYLTVESGQGRCVRLFRADAFPHGWQPVAELVHGWTCVDPTLYRHGDHWYLFANVAESGGSTWDELFLFVADDLAGPYRPHPANPIVCDARRARPAGRLFERGGRLVRPAQDCGPSYGAALVFNEVLELTPTHYRERPIGRLDTQWTRGLDGCHTYNHIDGLEVLDVRGVPSADLARIRVADPAVAGIAADAAREAPAPTAGRPPASLRPDARPATVAAPIGPDAGLMQP